MTLNLGLLTSILSSKPFHFLMFKCFFKNFPLKSLYINKHKMSLFVQGKSHLSGNFYMNKMVGNVRNRPIYQKEHGFEVRPEDQSQLHHLTN